MWAPSEWVDPFVGPRNPALPPTVNGAFNAWGMVRELVNTVVPQYIGDMNFYRSIN